MERVNAFKGKSNRDYAICSIEGKREKRGTDYMRDFNKSMKKRRESKKIIQRKNDQIVSKFDINI